VLVDDDGAEAAGDDGAGSPDVPPEQPAASEPTTAMAAIATAGRRLTAPSSASVVQPVWGHRERSVMGGRSGVRAALEGGMVDETSTVRDDRPGQRFVLEQTGGEGELTYEVEGGRLFLLHTEVDDTLRGRGAGGRLVRAAVARASDDGLTVVPRCPYARRWLREHPDVAETVTVDWRTRP
jgi:uncharacterized protein